LSLIVAGIAIRAYDLGYPETLVFDEHHFVKNARNYMAARSDWNDHPPLGKLLIALGMRVEGDDPFGWRLAALVFGIALILLAYLLGAAAQRTREAGLYAAAFVAASGFAVVYSRTAHLDGMLTTLMAAAALVAWRSRTRLGMSSAACLIGLAASMKFSGAVLAIPWVIVSIRRFGLEKRTLTLLAGGVALMAGTYVALFAFGLQMAGDGYGVADVGHKSLELLRHHLVLDDWKHPATSRWYTWFVPLSRIGMHYVRDGDTVRALTTADNPALWWGVNAAVAWSAFLALRRRMALPGQGYLLLLWLMPLLPWIFNNRDSYIYHYLPSYTFGLVLLGVVVASVEKPVVRFTFVAVVAAVFAFCAPVWSTIPFAADSWLHAIFY
jgi:dolichyl-phosphate-mannose--protein O-mannosyl transferase